MSGVLVRFSLEDRASRKRVKNLEKGDSEDAERRRQLGLVERFEEEMDEAVASIVGVDGKESLLAAAAPSSSEEDATSSEPAADASAQPVLTPAQRRMIKNLNAIPHLEKRIAMCDTGVYNHGTIVCREPKRLPSHERGLGIVRHWADCWVL